MKPKMIDWEETGSVLQNLRQGNLNLRRNVCRELRLDLGECAGDCNACTKEMDRSISRNELAKVFRVSEKTPLPTGSAALRRWVWRTFYFTVR